MGACVRAQNACMSIFLKKTFFQHYETENMTKYAWQKCMFGGDIVITSINLPTFNISYLVGFIYCSFTCLLYSQYYIEDTENLSEFI